MKRPAEAIFKDLARETARLAELGRAREVVRRRIELLRAELAAVSAPPRPSRPQYAPLAREVRRIALLFLPEVRAALDER